MSSERLSQRLARVLEDGSREGPATLNRLLAQTQGRGVYLVIIVLCLPFIVPLALPGVSTVMGFIIALLSLRLAFGLAPRLPKFLGERPLPPKLEKKLVSGSVKFLRLVEKLARPRRTRWLALPPARVVNASLIVFMALLLSLPFPGIPPFTNSLPSYAIILIAASMMEEDGVLIWFGYATALLTVIYLAFIAAVLKTVAIQAYDWIVRWFQ